MNKVAVLEGAAGSSPFFFLTKDEKKKVSVLRLEYYCLLFEEQIPLD